MQNGQIVAQIDPSQESPDQIAAKLSLLYGPLTVHELPDGRRLVSLEPSHSGPGDVDPGVCAAAARRGEDA
jgi:hypothetical protein